MERTTVQGAGVQLAVVVTGSGPGALVVHGIAADAATLAPLARALEGRARVVRYDRRGYGASTAPEPYEGTSVPEQAEDAAAVLRALDLAPALLVGDGFGALVALDVLKRHPGLARAAVLVEPPVLAFVPEATDVLAARRAVVTDRLREAGPAAAVAAWLGDAADPGDRERAMAAHRPFFADLVGLPTWPVTRRELRAIEVPAAIVTGPATPGYLVTAADALAALLPGARRTTDGDAATAARALV